jgi:hypothetical protein
MYKITDYTKKKAKQLGVEVKPSLDPEKKIDVYKDNKKIVSIGAKGYSDYGTYLREKGKSFADYRRKLYHLRHANDTKPAGYYARRLLW